MLSSIRIENFRNLQPLNLALDSQITIFRGANGQGKTSILEAIYVAAQLTSFRTRHLLDCVQFGREYFASSCEIDDHRLVSYISPSRKSAKLDGEAVKDRTQLFSRFHLFCLQQTDRELIVGPPEERRRFMNLALTHSEPNFLPLSTISSAPAMRHSRPVEK